MTYYHGIIAGGLTEAISERFYDSFLFLNTAFVFCFSKWWFSTHTISDAWRNRLIFLGSVSFGVMLFEEITRNLTHPIFGKMLAYLPRIPFIDAVIWICLAYALGIIITYFIKKYRTSINLSSLPSTVFNSTDIKRSYAWASSNISPDLR